MKSKLAVLMCAALVFSVNAQGAGSSKAKAGSAAKKADHSEAVDDSKTKEVTISGVMTVGYDGKAIIKVSGGFSGKNCYLPASKFNYSDFDMLDVKAVCMQRGPDVISVKSIEAVDKAAYKAKMDEQKAAAAAKEAEAKKAAQPKK